MKPRKQFDKLPVRALGWIFLTGTCLIPSAALAIDWSATTGAFSNGANWVGGVVPAATNATIENGGTATVTSGDIFDITTLRLGGHAGTGFITQSGGAVAATQIILGGDDAGGGTGQGTYSISGGSLNGTNGEMWIGSKGGIGTLQLSGGATVTNNSWIVVGRDGASGSVTVGGTSELKNLSNNIGIGVFSPGFSSTVTVQDSGKLTSANELYVGWLANPTNEGTLTVKDSGQVSVAAGLVIGRDNAKGTMNVSNTSSVNVGGYLVVGADGAALGEMTVNDSASVAVTRMVWLGQNGATGVMTMNGGSVTCHPGPPIDTTGAGVAFRGVNGTLNLNGGVLETPGFNKLGGEARVNFNGGVIRANEDTVGGNFFNNFADTDLVIQDGGMVIDSNGIDLTISPFISGSGGVTKSGAGSLALVQGEYAGDTVVNEGTLTLYVLSLSSSSSVKIAATGALLDLNSDTTVDKLFIDGVQQPAGIYEAVGNAAAGIEIAQLTGTGTLEVVSGPGTNTYQQWIAANAPASGFLPDSDADGVANGVEHVLGTNPNTSSAGLVAVSATATSATFKHTLNPSLASDVVSSYQWSTDLIEWKASGATHSSGTTAVITSSAPVAGEVTVTISISGGPAGKLFGRLVATQAP
ncbi:MAG: hypothetical protein V4640_10995 [Verrucomicrobiota bacterium]